MIEYIYDAIRANAGEAISINAKITQDNGEVITQNCYLSLLDNEKEIKRIDGIYDGDLWCFLLNEEDTKGLTGRYWYSIGCNDNSLNFKQPLYLK